MKNFTPPNAADNHQYRATTLKRIQNIFNSKPELTDEAVVNWIETITATLEEYFELIWPKGLGLSLNKFGAGLEPTSPLHAKDMHAFFDIKMQADQVLRYATDELAEGEFLQLIFECRDLEGFRKKNKSGKDVWITGINNIQFQIESRIKTESNIAQLMAEENAAIKPFDFAEFCNTYMFTHQNDDKRTMIETILQPAIRSLGLRYHGKNETGHDYIRFDLTQVLGFWRNMEKGDGEMRLAVYRHIQPHPAEIFDVWFEMDGIGFVSHECGHHYPKLRQQMLKTVREGLDEVFGFSR